MNVTVCCSAESDCCRNICKAALYEYNICRINCNIRSRSDCNTQVCACESRRIVNAVTDHCNLAVFFQLFYILFLTVRKNSCNNFINVCIFCNGFCGFFRYRPDCNQSRREPSEITTS